MKSMRIPLYAALGVAVLGIILGSFFDLNISQAIASADNGFALTVSAIGPTIGFAAVSAMGGGFIALAVKGKYHVALKVLFYVLAVSCFAVSIYFPGGEYFGINGFYEKAPEWVGYLIALLPEAAAAVGGYFLFKDCSNKNMWIVFCIIIVVLTIALVAIIPVLKDIVRRPRYRFLAVSDVSLFHNWWEPCKDFKDIMVKWGLDPNNSDMRDHFKSYPSGHTAEASILFIAATFLPLADKKFEKYQLPVFIGACVVTLLVAFARILAAAHFLSDVSFGATIVLVLTIIANEVVINIKALHPEEAKAE